MMSVMARSIHQVGVVVLMSGVGLKSKDTMLGLLYKHVVAVAYDSRDSDRGRREGVWVHIDVGYGQEHTPGRCVVLMILWGS